MLTAFKLKCLHEIEANIFLPETGWFVKNENSIRICYRIARKLKYIYLPSLTHIAAFLKKHSIINSYAYTKAEIKMFTTSFTVVPGPRSELVWQERLVPFFFKDIEFTKAQVITFAAIHEFEKAHGIMGKVLDLTQSFFKTVA